MKEPRFSRDPRRAQRQAEDERYAELVERRERVENRKLAKAYVQTFPLRHQDWTADQWFWRWLECYDEPTTLEEALQSGSNVGEDELRAAHARLLLLVGIQVVR